MARPTLSIPQADYDSTRESLKAFVKAQGVFSDVDFEGSYIASVVDMLAYNTSINNFYKTMAVGETRRSTAKLRTNVIARAQENGYIPKSFTSATAVLNIAITSNDKSRSTIVIPKGTVVTGRIDSSNFTFATLEPVITSVSVVGANSITFAASNVVVAEGLTVSESFVYTEDSSLFEISNVQVDTSSINVTVVEDQSVTVPYKSAQSVVGVSENDNVFFGRISPGGLYTVYFGDGITGRKPKVGSIVVVEYRVSNGQLPNGITLFAAGQTIDGESNVAIQTVSPAQGGDIYESTESIRFNGDQASIVQDRSVYQPDYENDLRKQFPFIADVSVVGGEDIFPPQYGSVVVTGVDKQLNNLTSLQLQQIMTYLAKRHPLGLTFKFATANIVRLGIRTKIRSDNLSSTVVSNVIAALTAFADKNLGKFGASANKSRIQTAIDNADSNIISNNLQLYGYVTVTTASPSNVQFNNRIASLSSTPVIYGNASGRLKDVSGNIVIVDANGTVLSPVIGTVDYTGGGILLQGFNANYNQAVDLIITPSDANILATGSMIIKVQPSDITIS
jgi:hypothetical protein